MPNRLEKESSPYLLQHAHNPVDWYPWGNEALQKARQENKPVLVSIGYSACHWCHVMERESFEDDETAAIMNRHFVNIKIDREERPDLDHIYMEAVQAMTGSGGWPLNVFLTPEGKPFYGGTYFPPIRAYNRPSWKELLQSIAIAFHERRQDIETQSENLIDHLIASNAFGIHESDQSNDADIFNKTNLSLIYENIMKVADKEKGGFGRAPKFPQTFIIQFLLQYYYYTKNDNALQQACLSLDKMIFGGIYDQVGGGFARYSTDEDWLVPHFEKMLYDNALLVTVMSQAYQLTRRDHYKRAIIQTMDFVSRELSSGNGGFYSALDADSEGEEGKYYVWNKSEIDELLQGDASFFSSYYHITEKGNWEGKNILHVDISEEEFAQKENLPAGDVVARLHICRKKLLEYRLKRVAPLLDDKILLGWDALMISACCNAYAALGIRQYKDMAIAGMDFLWQNFRGDEINYFYHTNKKGHEAIPAFLDDYAFLIAALIQLQEVTGDAGYLQKAKILATWVIEHFSEEETGYFFFTNKYQQDIIIRKKEVYDGALPSGNAVMSINLFYLAAIFDIPDWKKRAQANCAMLAKVIISHPVSFGVWATMIQAVTYGIVEVVITGNGDKQENICKDFLRNFIPNRVFQSATNQNHEFPLLRDKPISKQPLIFLCKEYSCQNPVTEINDLVRLLETGAKV